MLPLSSAIRRPIAPVFKSLINIQRRSIVTAFTAKDQYSKYLKNQTNLDSLYSKYKEKNDTLTDTLSHYLSNIVPRPEIINRKDAALIIAERYMLADPSTGILRPEAKDWMEILLAANRDLKNVIICACISGKPYPDTAKRSIITQYSSVHPGIIFSGTKDPIRVQEEAAIFRSPFKLSGSGKPTDQVGDDIFLITNDSFYSSLNGKDHAIIDFDVQAVAFPQTPAQLERAKKSP